MKNFLNAKTFLVKFCLGVAILFVGGVFVGCEKNEVVSEEKEIVNNNLNTGVDNLTVDDMPQIELIDGKLNFTTPEQYLKTLNIVNKMSDLEFMNWENKTGFKSLRTAQYNALLELDKINNEDEKGLLEWLKKYNNLFELVYDAGDAMIVEKVSSTFYSRVCNAEGIYYTENSVNKVIGSYLVSAPFEYKQEIENSIDVNFKDTTNIKVVNYEKEFDTKSTKLQSIDADGIYDLNGCVNDRKVNFTTKLEIYVYTTTQPSIYTWSIQVECKTKGYQKIVCIWSPYRTTLNSKNISGLVATYDPGTNFIHIDNPILTSYSIPDASSNGKDVYSLDFSYEIRNGGPYNSSPSGTVNYTNFSLFYFKTAIGNASSRGTNGTWAIMNYAY